MNNQLNSLIQLRFPSRFKRFALFFLLKFSRAKLTAKIGSGPIAIIYTVELNERIEYSAFIEEFAQKYCTEYSLYKFKRRFYFSFNAKSINLTIKENADFLYREFLQKHHNLVFFIPHQILSEAILSASEESEIKHVTGAMQHGFYKYSFEEVETFSKSNRTDHAYLFNFTESNIKFFTNVKKIHDIGFYFVQPKRSTLPKTSSLKIFLTKVSESELVDCLKHCFSNFGVLVEYKIFLHPHQKFSKNFLNKLQIEFPLIKISTRPEQGDVNIFYETTTFYSFENYLGRSYFLNRSGEFSVLESIAFSHAIQSLHHGIQQSFRDEK